MRTPRTPVLAVITRCFIRRIVPSVLRSAGLFLFVWTLSALAAGQAAPLVTLAEVKSVSSELRTVHAFELEAIVWYSDPASGRLILSDGSGSAEVQMDLGQTVWEPGDRIRISGTGTLMNRGASVEILCKAAVDNDGMHTDRERQGTLHLESGRHPVRLDWFNASSDSNLVLDYAGPGFSRMSIPKSRLFRRTGDAAGVETRWSPGLDFRTYQERQWMLPPTQNAGAPLIRGVAETFDFTVAGWREYVGINFNGFLEITEPGDYTFFLLSGDGSRFFIGPPSLRLVRVARTEMPEPRLLFPGQPMPGRGDHLWVSMEGRIPRASQIGRVNYLSLESGAGHVRVEIADTANLVWTSILNRTVRITGVAQGNLSLDGIPLAATLLVQKAEQIEILRQAAEGTPDSEARSFTTAAQIERLDPALLKNKPQVRIRGVVTRAVSGVLGVVIQDETRGIYVDLTELAPGPVQIGDLLEVDGTIEAGEFSPFIIARSITRLGAGVMPAPVEATREEMINGRLHSQYVEIEGYILAVDRKTVTLRTRVGILKIEVETEPSESWLNAVVRMRGCLRVFWDAQSKQITVGKVGMDYAEISIERPAPADLFDVAPKRLSELLRFDPYAEAFQRTRLVAQVIHSNGNELCLMDEGRGVRVTLATAQTFEHGDLVEIAGFPEFDGPVPHFAHAIARKTGRGGALQVQRLPEDDLLRDEYDSTLVSVDAELLGGEIQEGHPTLQLRIGPNAFLARYDKPSAQVPSYERGSILRVTGVYQGLGGNRSLRRPVQAFELLLNSPSAIQVLATPPWWTLPRLLTLLALLFIVLLLSFLWIRLLRRQVAVQTEQLKVVLQERHRVQQEEALAQERSRLAYDLHDELGAGLSEIGMLGTLASAQIPHEKRDEYLIRLTETVRRLIVSLDEIVWAVNPRYDSVSSFVGYYTAYAQQFLGLASLRCRLDVAEELPDQVMTSKARYSLFLAFKETLNNVVKHARASEVVIRIYSADSRLIVSVADNGCGLSSEPQLPGKDGLTSIRERLQQLEGECVVESEANTGTTVSLVIPLSKTEALRSQS